MTENSLSLSTEGYTGADISAVCNEAVMIAVRKLVESGQMPSDAEITACKVEMEHFRTAVEKIGPKIRKELSQYSKNKEV